MISPLEGAKLFKVNSKISAMGLAIFSSCLILLGSLCIANLIFFAIQKFGAIVFLIMGAVLAWGIITTIVYHLFISYLESDDE